MITESSQQEQLFASSTTQPSVLGELSYVSNDIFALKMFLHHYFASLFLMLVFIGVQPTPCLGASSATRALDVGPVCKRHAGSHHEHNDRREDSPVVTYTFSGRLSLSLGLSHHSPVGS